MNHQYVPVPGCKNTTVREMFTKPGLQILDVKVASDGEIPVHTHACEAIMIITQGRAKALGKGDRVVSPGEVVAKASREPHGFTDVKEPFSFISISTGEGILQKNDWDMQYVSA